MGVTDGFFLPSKKQPYKIGLGTLELVAMMVKIVTDSVADLPPQVVEELGITVTCLLGSPRWKHDDLFFNKKQFIPDSQ